MQQNTLGWRVSNIYSQVSWNNANDQNGSGNFSNKINYMSKVRELPRNLLQMKFSVKIGYEILFESFEPVFFWPKYFQAKKN